MAGEIIRMGDKTSHGGTVLEGSLHDICMGKPIAYVGHKTHCPKCKGTFPIIEGVLTTTFYGKGVAVAGMRTACGAVLIATQFTDTVEWSTGAGAGVEVRAAAAAQRAEAKVLAAALPPDGTANGIYEIETSYSLLDVNGNPIEGLKYDLYVDGKLHTRASTYTEGSTVTVSDVKETTIGNLEQ